ncbi:MAG: Co2+/Mg2+ efflux protein ApaG [Bdellovibrio sp.]
MSIELHSYREESEGIEIEARPFYVPEKSDITNNYFFYAYQILIKNNSDIPVTLINRYWIIRDGRGNERKVYGDGVVGQRPRLAPGKSFRYTSFCPLNTPTGNMRGKFEMMTDDGDKFWVTIPVFFFRQNILSKPENYLDQRV